MKLIDRYIIKKFLGTFVYAIALIITIALIFDFSEKVDDFIQKQAPFKAIVFEYYLNFIPYFINLFSPLFTFIAVVFFTSKMAYNTEIVAILASGISFRRMLRPYMIAAALLATASFFLLNFIIPKANEKRLAFENTYIKNPFRYTDHNIHKQISPGTFIYFESYNNTTNVGYRFAVDQIEEGKLLYKLRSDFIRWDTLKQKWNIENYQIRTFDGLKETIKSGAVMDTVLNIHPKDFSRRLNMTETMNYFELTDFINDEKDKGSPNIAFYEIEKYQRISLPFATFILTLIGVAIASRKVRGGIGLHIGLGLFISFSYILFMQVSNTFATNAGVAPVIAVWIPNMLYLLLAVYLLKIAPK